MLTLGIAYTKPGLHQDYAIAALKKGLAEHGDTFIDIKYFNDLNKIKKCDAVFMISYPDLVSHNYKFCDEEHDKREIHHSLVNTFRIEVYKHATLFKKRLLCLDSGFLNFTKQRDSVDNTYQLGWDRIKGLGKYYNENSPPDRWNLLGREVKEWKTEGYYTLVFGQVRYGVASQHTDVRRWYREVIADLLAVKPDRQVVIRLHPNDSEAPFPVKKLNIKFVPSQIPLVEHLGKAAGTLSFSSHSIVESVLNGIPSFCCSQLSMAYPLLYIKKPSDLYNTEMPSHDKIMQWLYDLCYTQWTTKEIEKGVAWNHLRPHATKIEDVRFDDMLCKLQQYRIPSVESSVNDTANR